MMLKIISIMFTVLLCLALVGVYIWGDFVLFILFHIFLFVIMLFRSLYVFATIRARLLFIGTYAIIMILQIIYTTLLTFSYELNKEEFLLFKLMSTTIILASPIIERLFYNQHHETFFMPSVQDFADVTYAQLIHEKSKIIDAVNLAKKVGKALSKDNSSKVLELLLRHSSFRYVSSGSLTEKYFKTAYASLNDEHVYIILTDSGSIASELIAVFTQRQFNHVSLSFDSDLQTIISYNGGGNVHPPGLNHEMVEYFNKKRDSSIVVYRLKATKEQKERMIMKIHDINHEGSAYNLLGLVFKYSFKPNIMFCSQFAYRMLEHAGLTYFTKRSTAVRPTDFVELDYLRKLEFVYEMRLNG